MIRMNRVKDMQVRLICIIIILISVTMLGVYFINFYDSGLSKNTNDFANFGSFIGGVLSFVTIALILLFNYENLEKLRVANQISAKITSQNLEAIKISKEIAAQNYESNMIAKKNLETNIKYEQFRHLYNMINSIHEKYEILLKTKVGPIIYVDFFIDSGILKTERFSDIGLFKKGELNEEFLRTEMNSDLDFESLILSSIDLIIEVEKVELKEAAIRLSEIVNKRWGQVSPIKHCFLNFQGHAERWIELLEEYDTLTSNTHEVYYFVNQYFFIFLRLFNMGYIDNQVYNYLKWICLLNEKKIDSILLFQKEDQQKFGERFNEGIFSTGVKKENAELVDIFMEQGLMKLRCIDRSSQKEFEIMF